MSRNERLLVLFIFILCFQSFVSTKPFKKHICIRIREDRVSNDGEGNQVTSENPLGNPNNCVAHQTCMEDEEQSIDNGGTEVCITMQDLPQDKPIKCIACDSCTNDGEDPANNVDTELRVTPETLEKQTNSQLATFAQKMERNL